MKTQISNWPLTRTVNNTTLAHNYAKLSWLTSISLRRFASTRLHKVCLAALIVLGACASTLHAQVWGPSHEYDIGYNPQVAMDGSAVVEVHNAGTSEGPMWYHVGVANESVGTVSWGPSYRYDNGYNPSVAADGPTVVEVHNAGTSE